MCQRKWKTSYEKAGAVRTYLVVEVAHPPVYDLEGTGGDVHGVDGGIAHPVNLRKEWRWRRGGRMGERTRK